MNDETRRHMNFVGKYLEKWSVEEEGEMIRTA